MAARYRTWTPDVVRQKMRINMLMRRLRDHALGIVEMTNTQIKAAEVVLRKCMPDLKGVEHSGSVSYRHTHELSDGELTNIATRGGDRTAETPVRETEPSAVH